VDFHDSHVPRIEKGHGFNYEMTSVPLSDEGVAKYDAVMVLTDHTEIDYARVVEHSRLVIDTRNVTRNMTQHREKIVKA
jgi:UDP-N-acetyl-D-glucosamine dehydrogenase